jgi:hypothetical protein
MMRPSLRDVADGARHQHAVLRLQRAEADLDGELGPVPSQPIQLKLRTHRPWPRGLKVATSMSWMPASKALGDKHLDELPNQIRARMAEELLGLRVDQNDLPLGVHDHHGVGSRFEEAPELGLSLLALRDVADGGCYKRCVRASHWRQADLRGKFGAVLSPCK